jgi:uncharacterized protein (DUF1015 family)
MLRVRPFAAIRPRPEDAPRVAAPPYDVVDTKEARAIAEGNPLCFLRVSRPELELPDDADPYADAVYARAGANFRRLTDQGVMRQDSAPGIYLYRQEADLMGARRSQTGVVCCCHIDDYASNIIKKHEKTRQAKEDDRTKHTLAINANAGPVFLMHRPVDTIRALIARDSAGTPLYDFTAPDGVRHTVWAVANPEAYTAAFATLPSAYIADGHHRAAASARAGAHKRAANPGHTGNGEYNWFLAVLFPADALTVLPYHRVVADLRGMTPAALIERLGTVGTVRPLPSGIERYPTLGRGTYAVYASGKWHELRIDIAAENPRDPVATLDYQVLSERVLGPVLGIGDIRTDSRIDFIGGIRGTTELIHRVDTGAGAVAFAMPPVRIDQIMAVSDAGQIMPPKSTWFEPKLRSGLLVHSLDS